MELRAQLIPQAGETFDPRVREAIFRNQPADLGSIWGDILGNATAAGVQAGTQLLTSLLAGGSAAGPARGLAAINAFGNQAIQTLQQILQMLGGGQISLADALSNAQRIAGALSNPQYVYQAQRGNDADALRQFKARAATLVQQIQQLASLPPAQTNGQTTPATQTVTTINPTTGQPQTVVVPVANSADGGFSVNPPTLLLLGGGLMLVLLLKK